MSEQQEIAKAKKNPTTKAQAAAALAIRGASMQEIAEMLDYVTPANARKAVESALAGHMAPHERSAAASLALQRYEKLIKSVFTRATNPKDTQQLAYNARAQALIEGEIKLLGLAAPTKVEVTPDQDYLEEYTRGLMNRLGLDPDATEEGDIFEEAEIVEEDDE